MPASASLAFCQLMATTNHGSRISTSDRETEEKRKRGFPSSSSSSKWCGPGGKRLHNFLAPNAPRTPRRARTRRRRPRGAPISPKWRRGERESLKALVVSKFDVAEMEFVSLFLSLWGKTRCKNSLIRPIPSAPSGEEERPPRKLCCLSRGGFVLPFPPPPSCLGG